MAEYSNDEGVLGPGEYWHAQLDQAQKYFDKWQGRAEKVVKRFRDERDAIEGMRKKFNILWSNIQVLTPSLYGRPAKPEVSRRNNDQDQIGRVASTILERVIDYEVSQFPDFGDAMCASVQDRLLPGRGVAWCRFEPTIAQTPDPHTPEQEVAQEGAQITGNEEAPEYVDKAHSPVDYVFWKDFLHSPARTWPEVWWVARWVYMSRDEGTERFGDVFRNVPCDSDEPAKDWNKGDKSRASLDKKAKVAEIWDKRAGKVCWVAKGYPQQLDERDDPLQLEGFFPCPLPLYATLSNGSMIPVPDFTLYQDQAEELDTLTNRIAMLAKSIKAVGVFNAEFKELSRMLNEGVDNKLFPVTAWAALAEKGGLKGAVDLLDLSTQIKALDQLYIAREQVKQTIYEVMGISDILRGTTKAQETLGAQQLKANFGSLRLRCSQQDVARYAADIFRIKAQIICKHYPPEIMVEMSGIMDTQDGQDPAVLQQAVQMLRNSTVRDFHINVSSDSLAQIDDQAEQQAAVEITTALGGFLKEALPLVANAPETLPLAAETLLYTVRRFKAGRALEGAIERTVKALEAKQQAAAANPAPPNPEVVKAQAEAQLEQQRQEFEKGKGMFDAQMEERKMAFEKEKGQFEAQLELQREQMTAEREREKLAFEAAAKEREQQADAEFERWKAELDAQTKIVIAEMQSQTALKQTTLSTNASRKDGMKSDENGNEMPGDLATLAERVNENIQELMKLKEEMAQPRGPRKVTLSSGRTVTVH